MDHDQLLRHDLEIPQQVRNALAAEIVERLRLYEDRGLFGEREFSGDALESAAAEFGAFSFRDSVDRHEAQVVTRAGVFFTGISQPCYHPLNLRARFRFGSFCAGRSEISEQTLDRRHRIQPARVWTARFDFDLEGAAR